MSNDHEIKVRISGASVYQAVANYLKNNEDLKEQIKVSVDQALNSSALEKSILRQVENEVQRYYYNKKLEKDIDTLIKRYVEERIHKMLPKEKLLDMIKSVVSKMLV